MQGANTATRRNAYGVLFAAGAERHHEQQSGPDTEESMPPTREIEPALSLGLRGSCL